jgi:hypothetical protein
VLFQWYDSLPRLGDLGRPSFKNGAWILTGHNPYEPPVNTEVEPLNLIRADASIGWFVLSLAISLTTIFAILTYCVASFSQTTYLISVVPVPSAIAFTCRYSLNRNHGCSSFVAFVSAVLIGATMMAWGSYNQTFNKGAVGFLVGGGWSSVVASAVFGAFLGMYGGVVSTVLYLIIATAIGRLDPNLNNQNAG